MLFFNSILLKYIPSQWSSSSFISSSQLLPSSAQFPPPLRAGLQKEARPLIASGKKLQHQRLFRKGLGNGRSMEPSQKHPKWWELVKTKRWLRMVTMQMVQVITFTSWGSAFTNLLAYSHLRISLAAKIFSNSSLMMIAFAFASATLLVDFVTNVFVSTVFVQRMMIVWASASATLLLPLPLPRGARSWAIRESSVEYI